MANSGASQKQDQLDASLVTDFIEFVRDEGRYGVDMGGNDKRYCPVSALRSWWTIRRISELLVTLPKLPCDAKAVRNRYLRTFSTLVYSNRIRDLGVFVKSDINDAKLPLMKPHEDWPPAEYFTSLFNVIFDVQWMFFPLRFHRDSLQKRVLPEQRILPMKVLDEICQGNVAHVQKVEIHDDCNELAPIVRPNPDPISTSLAHQVIQDPETERPARRIFVVKTYHNKRYKLLYDREVEALAVLMFQPSPNVFTYHGSFEQLGTFNLVLEYADGGNLAEMFENTPPPKTVSDVIQFWKSLVDVLNGLHRIHNLMRFDDKYLQGYIKGLQPDLPLGSFTNQRILGYTRT